MHTPDPEEIISCNNEKKLKHVRDRKTKVFIKHNNEKKLKHTTIWETR